MQSAAIGLYIKLFFGKSVSKCLSVSYADANVFFDAVVNVNSSYSSILAKNMVLFTFKIFLLCNYLGRERKLDR